MWLLADSESEKKLMAWVRPGVEETCACFEPTSAFSRLDLPTFERPRKATSGADGGGKCSGAVAESRNLGMRRITLIVAERDCRRAGLPGSAHGRRPHWPTESARVTPGERRHPSKLV